MSFHEGDDANQQNEALFLTITPLGKENSVGLLIQIYQK
jgi:hypothetical protein